MDISSLGITGVAAITVICLLVGQGVKASGVDNKRIPIICGVCGLALGIAGKYITAFYCRDVSGRAYPWCMAFIWWVFREAGFNLYKTASCTAFVRRYKAFSPGQVVTGGIPARGHCVFRFLRQQKENGACGACGLCQRRNRYHH